MKLFDICFTYILGNPPLFEQAKPLLPKNLFKALERRAKSKLTFSVLFEKRLSIEIPEKCLRYTPVGDLDYDKTLRTALCAVKPQDVFRLMVATNSRKYLDEAWKKIPALKQIEMTTDISIQAIRNEVLLRVHNDPNNSFIRHEEAFYQCQRKGWADAAVESFKLVPPELRAILFSRQWFKYFFQKNEKSYKDEKILQGMLHAKKTNPFEVTKGTIDRSFFMGNYCFEHLLRQWGEEPIPAKFNIPEIESWLQSYLTSPVGERPSSVRGLMVRS
ncbi:hypothetical protein L596_024641 [Steinernema carpocapsae]|uniref:Uncharacterized protein n=1 Tax=Steinernema carpocapsae TaxID=34508 RepID=A0A4V5ZYJ5_STECR|nr:hypothetical protein L596_024641 [Steinernema carpocapsae]